QQGGHGGGDVGGTDDEDAVDGGVEPGQRGVAGHVERGAASDGQRVGNGIVRGDLEAVDGRGCAGGEHSGGGRVGDRCPAVGSSQGNGVAGVAEVARGADDEGSAVDSDAAGEGVEAGEVERAGTVHGEPGGAGDGGRNGRARSRGEIHHPAA